MAEETTLTVVAALIWKDGRLLVCQRRYSDRFPGKWEFPGGKLEPHETPEEGLARELQEELGIRAEVGKQMYASEHPYAHGPRVLLKFHAVNRVEGSMENRVFEQIRWVLPGELAHFDFLEGDRELVARIVSGDIPAA